MIESSAAASEVLSMGWSPLGTQFCLELAFGVFVALAFVPKAPVGVLFYRVMGTTALVPVLVAIAAPLSAGQLSWSDTQLHFSLIPVVCYPVLSGPVRGKRWATALGLSILGVLAALALVLSSAGLPGGTGGLVLGTLSASATGAVAGSVGVAMVLGHWYLTVPNLRVSHLRRLNRVTVVSMLLSLALVLTSCAIFGDLRNEAARPLLGAWGMFHLGTRVAVGLLVPLVFAWMTAGSLKYENTRSATGILYASTVLVLIGAAVSVTLQDSYGIAL